MRTIICDIDGTLADCEHRRHFLPNWIEFYESMERDIVIEPVKHLVNTYYAMRGDFQIVLCSGRPEDYRDRTERWLMRNEIYYDLLFMRKSGDYRSDVIIKREMLREMRRLEFDILFVVDDRQKVVDFWRAEGLVCLQAAPSDWDKPKGVPGKLVIMIGPSGGGKTTYANEHFPSGVIVSSDSLREQLCGDFRDQSKNTAVFNALHGIVKARIESGLLTVVDATNIRRKDRTSLLELVPPSGAIEYIIIDRAMAEKEKTAGWRAEVISHGQLLMARHAEVFQMNLPYILAGDGDSRVTVKDLRHAH